MNPLAQFRNHKQKITDDGLILFVDSYLESKGTTTTSTDELKAELFEYTKYILKHFG